MTTLNKINISKNAESIIEDYHAPELISEVVTVINNILNLTEVPSEDYSVKIEGFTEVSDFDLLASNTVDDLFYVNYKQGYITLNKEHNFEKITVNYYGIGKSYLSAFRVYVGTDNTGNVAETLGDLFKSGENIIEALDVYGGYATMILRIDSTTEECNALLNKINQKLSQLSATDCQTTTVTLTDWTSSSDGICSYEYSIIHNLQSTNVLCEFENSAGVSINDGSVKYKVVSNDKIKVYSNSKLPVKVKYMARYYNGLDSTNVSNIRQEIEDARLNPTYDEAFSSVKENINYVSEQIKTLKKKKRIFKPNFGCTFYLGQANDLQGNHYTRTLAQCKEAVGGVIDYIDEVPITFHISYNENTSEFYIVEDRQIMYDLATWIVNEKGKTVPAIKMYAQRYNISHINSYGISNFHTKWKEFITEIGTKFKDLGVKYLVIHNESTYICGNSDHLTYLLEEIELAKSLGYKVAYDYAGGSHYNNTLPEFKEKLDAHFMNIYPPVTSLGLKATYNEVLNSFENEPYLDIINKVHNDYPNADVIINECGVQDNWYALVSPANFNWSNVEKSNGLVPAMYLQALLETTKNMDVKSVWWWYELSFDATRKVLNKYVRGEE